MAEKTNIVYFILDGNNDPSGFGAIDTDASDYIASANLDPITKNTLTTVRDSSGEWHSAHTVSAGVVASVLWTSGYTNAASGQIATTSALAVTNQTNITANDVDIAAIYDSVLWTSGYTNAASGQIATTSALAATNQTNIATLNTSAVRQNIQVAELGAVSANIATNTTNIGNNDTDIATLNTSAVRQNIQVAELGAVSANIATNTGNITTLTTSANTLNMYVSHLGSTSGTILTNTGNISSNLGRIQIVEDDVDVVGAVSGNIATNTANITAHSTFGYMQLDSDGTATVDETNLGAGSTVTNIVSDSNYISWNDTNKYFMVSAAGTYECLGVVILEGGSTLATLTVQKNGSDVLVGAPRVHSSVDPLEHTIRAVFTASSGDNISITYDAVAASNTLKPLTGSTMTVKRLA